MEAASCTVIDDPYAALPDMDAVSVHTPLYRETRGFIGARELVSAYPLEECRLQPALLTIRLLASPPGRGSGGVGRAVAHPGGEVSWQELRADAPASPRRSTHGHLLRA